MNRVGRRYHFGSVAIVLTGLTIFASIGASAAYAADEVSASSLVAQTVYLPLNNEQAAEARAREIQTPGNPNYHRFMSVTEFVHEYADSDQQVAQVEDALRRLGYKIGYVFPNHLAIEVTSTAETADKVLNVRLRHMTVRGRTGMGSSEPVTIPAELRGLIVGIGGLDTVAQAHPLHTTSTMRAVTPLPSTGTLTGGVPGKYLPQDFAKFYDVDPIYRAGFTGRGTTIGIVTLANYNKADPFSFWQQIGLSVSGGRITDVSVNGGTDVAPVPGSAGENETDLDIEEAGALAPDADLRTYISPTNTIVSFIDGFEAAASENIADSVSMSWGFDEIDYLPSKAEGRASQIEMFDVAHDAFLEMALQGQTVFIATGDAGAFSSAFDTSLLGACAITGTPSAAAPVCNAPYSVNHPASDPLVTAAGGTTLPYTLTTKQGLKVSVTQEQAWSYSYVTREAAEQGLASLFPRSRDFPIGGGGGVSIHFPLPWYQAGVSGMNRTMPNQTFAEDTGSGPVVQYVLPANFAGRNLPDISAEADPNSGYQIVQDGVVLPGGGGESFVAPQLNGVMALFVQALGKRVGQLNPALYMLGRQASPDMTIGDNWGYDAQKGYDNASGVGTLDATRLLEGLVSLRDGFR